MPLIALFFFLLLGARGLASCRLWSVMSRPKRKITMKGFRKGTFRHSYLHGDLVFWQTGRCSVAKSKSCLTVLASRTWDSGFSVRLRWAWSSCLRCVRHIRLRIALRTLATRSLGLLYAQVFRCSIPCCLRDRRANLAASSLKHGSVDLTQARWRRFLRTARQGLFRVLLPGARGVKDWSFRRIRSISVRRYCIIFEKLQKIWRERIDKVVRKTPRHERNAVV